MAASKSKAETKQVMDVSKPGKAAPDSSSRPIIVGHKPMIADPMVNPEKDEKEAKDSQDEVKVRVGGEKVVLPPGQEKPKPDDKEEAKPTEAEDEPEEVADDKPASSEAAVVDALAAQATAKKKENETSSEEKKRQEQVNKLIEEKTYYVPIGQVKQRKAKRYLLGIFTLLIVVAGGLAAVDAGMLDLGIQLPFDLIK